jgi:hypothetical protein
MSILRRRPAPPSRDTLHSLYSSTRYIPTPRLFNQPDLLGIHIPCHLLYSSATEVADHPTPTHSALLPTPTPTPSVLDIEQPEISFQ